MPEKATSLVIYILKITFLAFSDYRILGAWLARCSQANPNSQKKGREMKIKEEEKDPAYLTQHHREDTQGTQRADPLGFSLPPVSLGVCDL